MFATSRLGLWGNEVLAFRILKDGFIARVLRRIVKGRRVTKEGSGFVVICKVEVRSKHHELISSVVFDARGPIVAPPSQKRSSIGFVPKP